MSAQKNYAENVLISTYTCIFSLATQIFILFKLAYELSVPCNRAINKCLSSKTLNTLTDWSVTSKDVIFRSVIDTSAGDV